MTSDAMLTAPRPWRVPVAEIPVRGRVLLPRTEDITGVAPGPRMPFDPFVGAAFLAAASVTTGTVVVRDWPASDPDRPGGVDQRIRHLFAGLGVYVVRTAEGLTATSRSTSGELRGGRLELSGAARLAPLALVLAALADGPSTIVGADRLDPAVLGAMAALRAAGGATRWGNDVLVVEPRPLAGTTWAAAGDLDVALAGVVLGLRVPGIQLDDIGPLLTAVPAFDDLWLRLLWADEHLLPGTSGAH